MAKYDKTDLMLTSKGDLVIQNGDLALVSKQSFIEQSVRNRIRTNDPEWPDHIQSALAANLDDLRGRENSILTAQDGIQLITTALTRDGLIDAEDLYIQPVPMDKDTIVFFVFINSPWDAEPLGFEVKFGLVSGVSIKGVS